MKLFNWFYKLQLTGVPPGTEYESHLRVVFSNVIYSSIPIVYLLFILIDNDSYFVPLQTLSFDQFIVPIFITFCVGCLLLNKIGLTLFSRVVFLILWPLCLHVIPIVIMDTPSDYALAFPIGLIFHSVLIQLMFSYRNEFYFLVTFMLINVISLVVAPWFLIQYDLDGDIALDLVEDRYFIIDSLLYWLLFNLITFYTVNVLERFLIKLRDSKMLIEEQKNRLNDANKNLEHLVSRRTKLLEIQNEKLKEYAFYNAHLLRSPFTNIQGLVMMLNELSDNGGEDSDSKILDVRENLQSSIESLDQRINEIQKLVSNQKDFTTES